jgi:hypothetical protein
MPPRLVVKLPFPGRTVDRQVGEVSVLALAGR